MALAKKALAFMVMVAVFGVSLGAVYKVGDSAGWTTAGNVDYNKWSSTKSFQVGDTLVFNYNNQFHNVKQVARQDFQSCNATSSIFTYTTGSDSIILNRSGHFYYLCGFPGHCQAGQKVDILVTTASAPGVSPSPAPSAGSSPTGAPSQGMAPTSAQNTASSLYSSKLWLALMGALAFCVTGLAY